MLKKFRPENLKGKDHMGDLGTEGRIVMMNSKERRCRGVGWVQLAQIRIWWHAVMNSVMNLWLT
jgi:hypothetical protein